MFLRTSSSSAGFAVRQALMWILKIGVSAGLLYVLFRRIDLDKLWQLIRAASAVDRRSALGMYFVMLLVSTWRWRTLLAAQHVRVPFGVLSNSYLVASFANNFLPSNIGGDVVRIRRHRAAAGSKTLATSVVLADRGVGVLGLAFVAACGSTLAARRSDGPRHRWVRVCLDRALRGARARVFVLAWPHRIAARWPARSGCSMPTGSISGSR